MNVTDMQRASRVMMRDTTVAIDHHGRRIQASPGPLSEKSPENQAHVPMS